MRAKLILLIFLLSSAIQLLGQPSVTIRFKNELTHLLDPPAHLIIFTFQYKSDTVYYLGQPYIIKPPIGFEPSKSAYGFLQFNNHGWNSIDSQAIFFIDNYESAVPILYIDQNFDLDFNNESAYDFSKSSDIVVELTNRHYPDTRIKVGINPIVFQDKEHESRTESYVNYDAPFALNNEFLPAPFWVTETRYNYKTSVKSDNIGLKDYNSNGRFNDLVDQILIADSLDKMINDRAQIFRHEIGQDSIIAYHGQNFSVTSVDSLGNFITLELLKDQEVANEQILLRKGVTMPDFEFTLFDNEKTTWKEIIPQDKYVLIDFWGTWCKPCITQSSDLKKFKSKYSNRLEILGLAYQDDREKARAYAKKNNLNWIQGFASRKIVSKFQVINYPYYILVGPDNKILSVNSRLNEIELLIK